jgi:hypothetical protein
MPQTDSYLEFTYISSSVSNNGQGKVLSPVSVRFSHGRSFSAFLTQFP